MSEEVSSENILNYLRGKYLSKPAKAPVGEGGKDDKVPAGEESGFSGEEAENQFLLSKLEKVQGELTKWLDILKAKINN